MISNINSNRYNGVYFGNSYNNNSKAYHSPALGALQADTVSFGNKPAVLKKNGLNKTDVLGIIAGLAVFFGFADLIARDLSDTSDLPKAPDSMRDYYETASIDKNSFLTTDARIEFYGNDRNNIYVKVPSDMTPEEVTNALHLGEYRLEKHGVAENFNIYGVRNVIFKDGQEAVKRDPEAMSKASLIQKANKE